MCVCVFTFSHSSDVDRICLQCGIPGFNPWVRKIPLEKGMATHSSILAWEILWKEEPGILQYMGSQRVGHHRASNTVHLLTHKHTLIYTCFFLMNDNLEITNGQFYNSHLYNILLLVILPKEIHMLFNILPIEQIWLTMSSFTWVSELRKQNWKQLIYSGTNKFHFHFLLSVYSKFIDHFHYARHCVCKVPRIQKWLKHSSFPQEVHAVMKEGNKCLKPKCRTMRAPRREWFILPGEKWNLHRKGDIWKSLKGKGEG